MFFLQLFRLSFADAYPFFLLVDLSSLQGDCVDILYWYFGDGNVVDV